MIKTDIELVKKFHGVRRNFDDYFDSLEDDVKQAVLDYLNEVLPIVYSKENSPEDFWNTTSPMRMSALFDGGGYEVREKDGEKCYVVYFDCDSYRFEGWVYMSMDLSRAFFTDWDESLSRAREISKYF